MARDLVTDVIRQVRIAREVLEEEKPSIEVTYHIGSLHCRHPKIVIYRGTAVVECRDCKAWLNPVDVLTQFANGARRLEDSRAALKKLRESICELEREEKNLKSRIARAKKRAKEQT